MSPEIKKALYYSAKWHDGQYRKGDIEPPYIVHPVSVAFRLAKYDLEMLQVIAILHDTIEDTSADYGMVELHFGKTVADAVELLTNDLNRKDFDTKLAYKKAAIDKILSVPPSSYSRDLAIFVKIYDIIDNIESSEKVSMLEEKIEILDYILTKWKPGPRVKVDISKAILFAKEKIAEYA